MTLRAIGASMGLNGNTIRTIEQKAFRKLRYIINHVAVKGDLAVFDHVDAMLAKRAEENRLAARLAENKETQRQQQEVEREQRAARKEARRQELREQGRLGYWKRKLMEAEASRDAIITQLEAAQAKRASFECRGWIRKTLWPRKAGLLALNATITRLEAGIEAATQNIVAIKSASQALEHDVDEVAEG